MSNGHSHTHTDANTHLKCIYSTFCLFASGCSGANTRLLWKKL